jgi:hypothetical protein
VRTVPHLCKLYPGICLTTEEKDVWESLFHTGLNSDGQPFENTEEYSKSRDDRKERDTLLRCSKKEHCFVNNSHACHFCSRAGFIWIVQQKKFVLQHREHSVFIIKTNLCLLWELQETCINIAVISNNTTLVHSRILCINLLLYFSYC